MQGGLSPLREIFWNERARRTTCLVLIACEFNLWVLLHAGFPRVSLNVKLSKEQAHRAWGRFVSVLPGALCRR